MVHRLILLGGLIAHKLIWELLRRADHQATPPAGKRSWGARVVKILKITVLAALLLQTLAPELFPISRRPARIRGLGLLLFTMGLLTAVAGRLQLGDNWANVEDATIIPEQQLVTRGIYRYIRHPIYSGDLLLLAGLQLTLNSWLVLGVPMAALLVWRRACAEEEMLAASFEQYESYRRSSKRFLPFLI